MTARRTRAHGVIIGALLAALVLSGCTEQGGGAPSTHPPSPTPEPTITGPESAADRADEVFGRFDEVEARGAGDTVIPLPAEVTEARAGIIRMTYQGTTRLRLWGVDDDGGEYMVFIDSSIPLVSADPATFDGESMWWPANSPPHALRVEGDGEWELSVAPVSSAPLLPTEGDGGAVYLYEGPGGAITGRKPDTEVGMSILEISLKYGGETIAETIADKRTDVDFTAGLSPGPSVIIVTHRSDWYLDIPIEEW